MNDKPKQDKDEFLRKSLMESLEKVMKATQLLRGRKYSGALKMLEELGWGIETNITAYDMNYSTIPPSAPPLCFWKTKILLDAHPGYTVVELIADNMKLTVSRRSSEPHLKIASRLTSSLLASARTYANMNGACLELDGNSRDIVSRLGIQLPNITHIVTWGVVRVVENFQENWHGIVTVRQKSQIPSNILCAWGAGPLRVSNAQAEKDAEQLMKDAVGDKPNWEAVRVDE